MTRRRSTPSGSTFRDWPHRWFGFWAGTSSGSDALPTLFEIVDKDWWPPDRDALLFYLERTPVAVAGTAQPLLCQICGRFEFDPSAYRYDGLWLWPTDLAHLVATHSVRLPEALVERIRQRQYRPPTDIEVDQDRLPFPKL